MKISYYRITFHNHNKMYNVSFGVKENTLFFNYKLGVV
jgi:hypothetical protein